MCNNITCLITEASDRTKVFFLKEYFQFIKERKKILIAPVLILLAVFSMLIFLSSGSLVAPFVYTLY